MALNRNAFHCDFDRLLDTTGDGTSSGIEARSERKLGFDSVLDAVHAEHCREQCLAVSLIVPSPNPLY